MPHRGPTYLAEESLVTELELCLSTARITGSDTRAGFGGPRADRRRSIRRLAESIRLAVPFTDRASKRSIYLFSFSLNISISTIPLSPSWQTQHGIGRLSSEDKLP